MKDRKIGVELHHVSANKVHKILKSIKSSKSTGIDTLDSFSIKTAADVIVHPLQYIIFLSIMQSKFPTDWKFSKVIPLHKKGSKFEKQNYRPVAILSPLSKVFERVVYDQIYSYFHRNKIFNENSHGFRRNRSTHTALLTMYDRWTRAASKGQISGVVLMDLSCAFDLVDHQLLLQKLSIYGIKDDLLHWIKSYLCDRYQSVWIDHILSDFLHCEYGVPQGSILGPLFFLIFSNDLPATLECHTDAYADDTTLTASGNSVTEVEEQLNKACMAVSDWMRSNQQKLNAGKCHLLTMRTHRKLRSLDRSLEVSMDGVNLMSTECQTLLGCKIRGDLKWNDQVNFLVKKLISRLNALRHLRYCCPCSLKKSIAEGIFNSTLVYCLPVFGGLDKNDIKTLQILQNKAARVVCQAPLHAKRTKLFDNLGWLTINQMISYHTVLTIQKVRVQREPEHLAKYMTRDSRNGRIMFQNQLLSVTSRSFCYRGAAQWNLIPHSLQMKAGTRQFKSEIKRWILANVPKFLD